MESRLAFLMLCASLTAFGQSAFSKQSMAAGAPFKLEITCNPEKGNSIAWDFTKSARAVKEGSMIVVAVRKTNISDHEIDKSSCVVDASGYRCGGQYYVWDGGLLLSAVSTIWFIMPFAAVQYGLRDRFVQLAFAVALGTTAAFLFMPEAPIMFAATALALVAASLMSERWRRPVLALLVIGIANVLLSFVSIPLLSLILHAESRFPGPMAHYLPMIPFRGSLLLLAIVCSLLHARLLPPTIARGAKVQ